MADGAVDIGTHGGQVDPPHAAPPEPVEPASALVSGPHGLDRRSRGLLAGTLRAMDEAARRGTLDRFMGPGDLPGCQTLLPSRARDVLEFLGVHGSRAHEQALRELRRANETCAPTKAHVHAFEAFVCRSEQVERL
jgi:hypothetical protein